MFPFCCTWKIVLWCSLPDWSDSVKITSGCQGTPSVTLDWLSASSSKYTIKKWWRQLLYSIIMCLSLFSYLISKDNIHVQQTLKAESRNHYRYQLSVSTSDEIENHNPRLVYNTHSIFGPSFCCSTIFVFKCSIFHLYPKRKTSWKESRIWFLWRYWTQNWQQWLGNRCSNLQHQRHRYANKLTTFYQWTVGCINLYHWDNKNFHYYYY